MKLEQIVTRLEWWKKRQLALTASYDMFYDLTRAGPDCNLFAPVFDVWTAYTVAVSELVGDKNEWLQWYEFDCRMGANPMEVQVRTGGKFIKIKTIRQLARVIANKEAA